MKKFFVIAAFMFAVFYVILSVLAGVNGQYFNTNDYYFHLYKARGSCFTEHYDLEKCENYAPAFALLAGPFSGTESQFVFFVLAILIFLIPGIIYFKTKSLWSLLIYFSSSFIFNTLYASIFAQMILSVLVVLMLFNDKIKPLKDLAYFAFGIFVHSHAVLVLWPILIYKFLNHFNNFREFKEKFLYVFLMPKSLDFSTILKIGPLVNWLYSLTLDWRKILLIAYFLVAGIVVDFRAVLFIPLLWAYWLPEQIQQKHKFLNKYLLVFLNYIFWLIFQFIVWFGDIQALKGF